MNWEGYNSKNCNCGRERERKNGRECETIQGGTLKTSIQTCCELDILFSLSISCSPCLCTTSFPDAQAEVFPLMKRMEFFKLKSLIKSKVFHPFTIALCVQLPFSALFTMAALTIKGITVGRCCHWKYRNEDCGEKIDMSSSTVVSILS